MSNLPLGAQFDSSAPWNQEDIICPECDSNEIEMWDSGVYRGHKWTNYICTECKFKIINEPDYE